MPSAFMTLLFATVAAASTVPAQIDAILKDYGRADAPGASVLVTMDGKVLYRKAFGLANLEERTPVTRLRQGRARGQGAPPARAHLGAPDYEELIPPGTTVPLKDKDVLDPVGKQDRLYFAPGSQFSTFWVALVSAAATGDRVQRPP